MEYITTRLGRFKVVAWLEGVSFLVLIGIAVPLKYIWGQPWLVQHTGMIHGLLFILYIFNLMQVNIELRWPTGSTLLAMAASFVPFGTFYVTTRMLPRILDEAQQNRHD